MTKKPNLPVLNFDLDGTLVDTYSVNNWLGMIKAESIELFKIAEPMRKSSYAWIQRYSEAGGAVNIITKTPAGASREYAERVARAKMAWIEEHLKIKFDNVFIIDYYAHKNEYSKGLLFDDSEAERADWQKSGLALKPEQITKTIKTLLSEN